MRSLINELPSLMTLTSHRRVSVNDFRNDAYSIHQCQSLLFLIMLWSKKCQLVFDKAAEFKIELLYLPSYSPNLNLIELISNWSRKNVGTQNIMRILTPLKMLSLIA